MINCINLFHPYPSHTCVNICTWLFLPHIHINVCTWLSPYTQWMLKHMYANIYIHTLSACIIASSWQIIIGQEENWYYPKYLFYHCYERHVWIIQLIGKIVITTYRVLLLWNEISFFYKPVCIINTFIRSMEWAFETKAYVLWMSLSLYASNLLQATVTYT